MKFQGIAPLLALVFCVATAGCGVSSDRTSGNQMMLVRESPDSLGYRKLKARSEACGDLRIFLEEKGLPDFMAEANSSNRNYLIFYYLEKHQAFACRTKGKGGTSVEFAGPYPMTKGEWKLLNGVKTQMVSTAATR